MFIICSFINKNKPQNDQWAETHAQLMLSIDCVGEQAAGLELTWLYIFYVYRATRAAQETGASENVHTANPGWTFKESQDQTTTPSPPLQMNTITSAR